MSMYATQPAPKENPHVKEESEKHSSQAEIDAEKLRREYARLSSSRAKLRQILDSDPAQTDRESWAQFLLPAAHEILSVLTQLSSSKAVWSDARDAEMLTGALDEEGEQLLRHLVDANLLGLIELMGYQPPPPSIDLVIDLQDALGSVLSTPDRALRAEWSRQASFHLAIYIQHLRRLITAAEQLGPEDQAWRSVRARTIEAVRAGLRAAAPATLAAFVTTLLFPTAGAVGFAGAIAQGGDKAMQEFAKQGVQLAATGVVGRVLAASTSAAEPADVYRAAVSEFVVALMDLRDATTAYQESPSDEGQSAVRALAIEVTRWFYQVLQAQAGLTDTRERLTRSAQADALTALRQIQDWTDLGIESEFEQMVSQPWVVVSKWAVMVARHVEILTS